MNDIKYLLIGLGKGKIGLLYRSVPSKEPMYWRELGDIGSVIATKAWGDYKKLSLHAYPTGKVVWDETAKIGVKWFPEGLCAMTLTAPIIVEAANDVDALALVKSLSNDVEWYNESYS